MKHIVKNAINFFRFIAAALFLSNLSMKLAIFWPSNINIFVMRMLNGIQFSTAQLKSIILTIKKNAPCKLLVFGLGNDSLLWSNLNKNGTTFFIEDSKDWLEKVTGKYSNIKAFLVNYNTKVKDWEKLLKDTAALSMPLPEEIEKEKWDIILVDAPAGFYEEHPGRMKSIYISSKLIKESGNIFVHDCNRTVEDNYCDEFLKEENLISEIKGGKVFLRHYVYKSL
jgi:glucuronoxylan 4-O-methyltransferase